MTNLQSDEIIAEHEEIQEGFVIDCDIKAEWALRKLAKNKQRHNSYIEVCEQQMKYYQDKINTAKEAFDSENKHLTSMLARYFESETVSSKARKGITRATYKLPSGKLIKTFEKQKMEYDEERLIKFLEGTDFVKFEPKLKWADFKKTVQIVGDKVVDENGEIVDCIWLKTEPACFNVEV